MGLLHSCRGDRSAEKEKFCRIRPQLTVFETKPLNVTKTMSVLYDWGPAQMLLVRCSGHVVSWTVICHLKIYWPSTEVSFAYIFVKKTCFRGHTASRWKVLCCCWSDDDDFKIPDYNTESCVVWRAQRSEDLKSYTAWLKRSLVRTGRGILLPLDTFRLVFLTSSSCQQALLYSSFTAGALLRDQSFLSFLRWILTENRPPTYSSV